MLPFPHNTDGPSSSSVAFSVSEQIGALTEGLPAVMTLVRLLPSVDSSVLDQDRTSAESLRAHVTRIRFLPAVDSLMEHEG